MSQSGAELEQHVEMEQRVSGLPWQLLREAAVQLSATALPPDSACPPNPVLSLHHRCDVIVPSL